MSNSGVRIPRATLGTVTRVAAGGQGVVYTAPGIRMAYADSLVFKEYKSPVLVALDIAALEAMPQYLETLTLKDGIELLTRAAWPCRLVEDASVVQGFVMPAIPDKFFMNMRKASGNARVAGEFQHLLNDASFLARRNIDLHDRHRYELLEEVAKALETFHRHNITVGDLSPKNLLFALHPRPSVYFIDCDAMRLKGASVLPQLETPGWEVRASNPGEELATIASDNQKLGLLALRLLAGDQTTRDPAHLPTTTPFAIRQLINEALSQRPAARPTAEDWKTPLVQAAASASTSIPKPATTTRTPTPTSRSTTAFVPLQGGSGTAISSPRRTSKVALLIMGVLAAIILIVGVHSTSPDSTPATSGTSLPVAQAATVSASCVSAPSQDAAGNTITYGPENMLDGSPQTAWRCDGSGVGQTINVTLRTRSRISYVGILPGYAKIDASDGTDRFLQNGRVSSVRYDFDDGSSFSQNLDANDRSMQIMHLPNTVDANSFRITIIASVPGEQSGSQPAKDKIAISELIVG